MFHCFYFLSSFPLMGVKAYLKYRKDGSFGESQAMKYLHIKINVLLIGHYQ